MELKGKFKEDFFEWFKIRHLRDSHTIFIFEVLPQSAQFGLIQEYCDTLGPRFDCETSKTYSNEYIAIASNANWNGYKTRPEAERKAVEEIQKIINV